MNRIATLLIALSMVDPVTALSSEATNATDRLSVDLTVYNQNLSLIREVRTLSLARGISKVIIPDIPSTIDGTSLHFVSLSNPASVRVLEQNYQYDLVHQAKILEKYIGRQVEFVRYDAEAKKEYTVPGRLLATGYVPQVYGAGSVNYVGTGGMIAEINGKIEINPAGRLVLPGLPEGLILKPQLEWLVSNTREGEHRTQVSYLAGQLSWSATYVALLDRNDTSIDLTGWVTLTNHSGTSFKNAGLKLVAGDVNLVRQAFDKTMAMRGGAAAEEAQFTQGELFEYKLYTLQRRTDLNTNETKQIELASGRSVPAKKLFIYDGLADLWRHWANNYSYRSQESFGQQSNSKFGVFVTFKNDQKSGLGIPLPKGIVRVYKKDDDGKEQFIGEDAIDHTPKDEEIRLYLGNAFDLVGSRSQKDFKSLAGGRIIEETIEINVRNHKDESVEVMVYEHPWRWSQWEILAESTRSEKVDQTTLRFPLRIGKGEERKVVYTIRYSW
jgi:hypothetical protein